MQFDWSDNTGTAFDSIHKEILYTNFVDRPADNLDDETCVQVMFNEYFEWDNVPCAAENPYICEIRTLFLRVFETAILYVSFLHTPRRGCRVLLYGESCVCRFIVLIECAS